MKVSVEKGTGAEKDQSFLIVRIPMTKRMSASQKSIVVATTSGNKSTDIVVDGKNVVIGLNAYIPV